MTIDLDKLTCLGMQAAYDNALMDAAVTGNGFVMLMRDETGIHAVELDPEKVTHQPPLGTQKLAREASLRLANRIEDALAGLLINGVDPGSIDVQHHPDNRTVICVAGVPKYEFTTTFTVIDQ